ncbi:hypothetical protein [Gallaecimonas xiamenensis]|uniref:DUF3375 domain-containing protein n=1 Tax=Gallaecimonas xiamenensis 3-C-1 TaxID=745411 RepID=K2K8R2_9GAMM|nr:hypothetical protein [Gallaecimonas xiamenensis]EKE73650.1 hypothetical protein B3C1_09642 [Gallaecimonas xiamenensis 3-C-1]
MHHPSKIIRLLAEHWPTFERLVERFGFSPFSFQDLQGLFRQQYPDWGHDKVFKEAERLLSLDLVLPLPKSSLLELNGAVFEFVQYLVKEHQLGLAGEIEAQLEEIARLSAKLEESLEALDTEDSRRYLRRIDNLVRKIGSQFKDNEGAIYRLAETAKGQSSLSLNHRYQLVLDAFDDYIEPMVDMLDTNGRFAQALDALSVNLHYQHRRLERAGHLFEVRNGLLLLRTRILVLFNEGRESLRRASDLLLPLRQELRKNTLIAKAASALLGEVRKKGLERALTAMPVLASDGQRRTLASQHQLLAYLGDIANFQEQEVVLPDDDDLAPPSHMHLPDPAEVQSAFKASGQQSAIHWLVASYPDLAADELLHLYQHIQLQAEAPHGERQTLELKDCTIQLHPLEIRHAD